MASYQVAVLKRDQAALASYSLNRNAIFKDMAVVEEAVLLLESNKTAEAHQRLSTISKESPVYKVSRLLLHYGVK